MGHALIDLRLNEVNLANDIFTDSFHKCLRLLP